MRISPRLSIYALFLLCIAALMLNVLDKYVFPDIQGYIERKAYYESVISTKGLSQHKADYWRPKDGEKE